MNKEEFGRGEKIIYGCLRGYVIRDERNQSSVRHFVMPSQLSNFCLHLRTVRFVVFLSRPTCYHVFHLTFEESGDN